MKRYKIYLLWVAACILALAVLLGCEEGPPGPAGAPEEAVPGISGTIEVHAYDELSISAEVAVEEPPSVPSVLLDSVSSSLPADYSEGVYRFSFADLAFAPGDAVHLLVNYAKADGSPGEAFGDIVIPDTFQIIQPDTFQMVTPGNNIYSLPIGDSLLIAWSASAGARAYSVWFYLQYIYLDTTQADQYFYLNLDTLITDTSIFLSPTELFPDLTAMDSLLASNGGFHVRAKSGPLLPGNLANIDGDGQGFFNAWSETVQFSIFVQP